MFFTVREGKDKLWLLEQYREEWYVAVFFKLSSRNHKIWSQDHGNQHFLSKFELFLTCK